MKQILTLLIIITTCTLFAQQPKKKVIESINTWYKNNPEKYTLSIKGEEATAVITRYYPKREGEKNDIIKVLYKGMKISLKFDKPFDQITTHKDSLQKYFSYVSLLNIYNDIPVKGWNVYPQTPSSSLRRKGVKFTSGGDVLGLIINWSTYTVMGYKDSAKCNDEQNIADASMSEGCYVSVRKRMKLEVVVSGVAIE